MSICVPTIGRIEFLAATRAALAAQTRRDFEVLVLDNATSPDAAALLRAWAADDPRVRVLRTETRVPMFANFNRGVVVARGDTIAFCHDDDRLRPSFVERHVAFFDAHPAVGFAGSNYDFIDEAGIVRHRSRVIACDGTWRGKDYVLLLMGNEYNPLTMQSVVFRASAFQGTGFDEALSPHFGDFVVLMRLAEKHDVGHLAAPLVEVRKHVAQASASMSVPAGLRHRSLLLGAYCDEYAARWPSETDRHQALRRAHRRALAVSFAHAWLAADSDEASRACLEGLVEDAALEGRPYRLLGDALRVAERFGLVAARRRVAMALARRAKRIVRSVVAQG